MTRSKSSGVAILTIFWTLLMGAQNHGPLQPGAPGYSPSSWGAQVFEPESGAFEKDSYTNKYFDLSFPVLPDWREDYQGPPPSTSGYYVLEGLRTKGELNGTILIAAQDTFFLPVNNSLDLLKRRQEQAVVSLLKIEASPRKMKMGNQDFARLDYSGAGLYHAIFAIDLRCHIVTFEITTRDQGVLQKLATNVSNLSLHAGEGPLPRCVKDYATSANVLHRVDPAQTGPKFTQVPVRVIIDKEGKVKHIHVINALPDQARSVESALALWVFKPYVENGRPMEIETGILFEVSSNKARPAALKEASQKESAR